MKNKIILVGGYPAAGKTAFARRLSQELNIPCFNYDVIDEMICDVLGPEIVEVFDDFDKGSQDIAFHCMLHTTEQLLQTEKACILEGSFELAEIEAIKVLLNKYNCECLLFVLKGDPRVMLDRYKERDRRGERHWIHAPAYEDWFTDMMPATRGLEEVETEQKIIVDTTSFDAVDYDGLLGVAKGFVVGGKGNEQNGAIPFKVHLKDDETNIFHQLIDDIRAENQQKGFLTDDEINAEILLHRQPQ